MSEQDRSGVASAAPPAPLSVVAGLAWLLVFQVAGELIVIGFNLPFPGPVVGMLALFSVLVLRNGWSGSIEFTADGILRHLPVLFIPAGVGVMVHFDRMHDEWLALVLALVGSTILGLAVTGLVMQTLARLQTHRRSAPGAK